MLQGQGVALDGCGGVDVAGAGVFLQGWNPGELDGGALDALAEAGDFLDPGQEGWGDGENGLVTHGNESSISQVLCQVLVRWCVKFCHLKR